VPAQTDTVDLGSLRLEAGEGRRLEFAVAIEPLELGGESYSVAPSRVPVRLDLSRTLGDGYALRLRFEVTLEGPCVRCLEPASPSVLVDAREVSQPGAGEELDSPYLEGGVLELSAWARDALMLTLPAVVLCRPDCAGLCPGCGIDLNTAEPGHSHPVALDSRWAALSELQLE
jgi:uncharacterized protein